MTPRINSAYYDLDAIGQTCYLNGMPIRQCQETIPNGDAFFFRNEKMGQDILSGTQQRLALQTFEKSRSDHPFFTLFASSNTDDPALGLASYLLKSYMQDTSWHAFRFVNILDRPPVDADSLQDIYILQGIHEADPQTANWARTWLRARLGVPLWLCVVTQDAPKWYREHLGMVPHFLFSVKNQSRAIG